MRFLLTGLLLVLSVVTSDAQYTNISSVLDSAGSRSAGGNFTNISAVGQPGGVSVSSGGSYVHQAGFLGTFSLRPGQDTDLDGLADELDSDNDNDQLSDVAEVTGAPFTPVSPTGVNTADSDGDATPDGAEAIAGTDPNAANNQFILVAFTNSAGNRQVTWVARGNSERTYVVLAHDGAFPATSPQAIFSNSVAGGAAPWYVVTNTVSDASAPTQRTYTVRVQSP